jgi:hypothetical protein
VHLKPDLHSGSSKPRGCFGKMRADRFIKVQRICKYLYQETEYMFAISISVESIN